MVRQLWQRPAPLQTAQAALQTAEVDNGKIMGFAADLAADHPVSLLSLLPWEMLHCLGAHGRCPVACVTGPVPTVCGATGSAAAHVSLLAP